jgi:hypothetical protein
MAAHRVQFTLSCDDPVTLRMQFEGQPEIDPRAYVFKDRATLERAFAFVGLAPAGITPLNLVGFWKVTDEQLAGIADGRMQS